MKEKNESLEERVDHLEDAIQTLFDGYDFILKLSNDSIDILKQVKKEAEQSKKANEEMKEMGNRIIKINEDLVNIQREYAQIMILLKSK